MSLQELTTMLGWAAVLNMSFLVVAFALISIGMETMMELHGKMFGLDEKDLRRAYFRYLAQYKTLVFVFNLAPYLALRLMG